VLGLGMAISVAPLTTTVMGAVKQRQAGIASGINNAVARTAGLMAIAIFNIFVFNTFNRSLNGRLAALNIPLEVQKLLDEQRIKLAGAEVPASVSGEVSAKLKGAIALAFVDSFRLVMLIGVGLALASAVVAFVMIGRNKRQMQQQ
jgi:hypothetical protein